MCYYCGNQKKVRISVSVPPEMIKTETKTLLENLRINGHKINNCPMCGRKLTNQSTAHQGKVKSK